MEGKRFCLKSFVPCGTERELRLFRYGQQKTRFYGENLVGGVEWWRGEYCVSGRKCDGTSFSVEMLRKLGGELQCQPSIVAFVYEIPCQ